MDEAERIRIALVSGPRLNPSFNDVWHGKAVEGSPWTQEQLATLKRMGRSTTKVWWYDVPLLYPNDRPGADVYDPYITKYLRCPLIVKSRDGRRVKIIAPSGDVKWTDATI
ncbi:hypothetical protein [Sphingomonas sp. CARO-RG-8B-R24-01]|uniref:hypothetical protein n=1 Tax=Sphingomonas sp. CARO-RG-8B-R24-01 TaxID=2914831 RepID=UPI001F5670E7|nr:hypothetical protein [Sphingomonas sp. CARO-RG-8B-R24-01]